MELVHQLSTYDTQGLYILVFGLGAVILTCIMISILCEDDWKIAAVINVVILCLYIVGVIKFYTEPRPQKVSDAYTIIKRSKTLELKSKNENQQSAIVDLIDEDEKTYVVRYKGESYIIPKETETK